MTKTLPCESLFAEQWEAVLAETVAFDVQRLSLSSLEGNKISAADMADLDWLFEE